MRTITLLVALCTTTACANLFGRGPELPDPGPPPEIEIPSAPPDYIPGGLPEELPPPANPFEPVKEKD